VARSASESFELYPLIDMDRMQATSALNRQLELFKHPKEVGVSAARSIRCIHLELPRATGVARSASGSFGLHPLMDMDRMQATGALNRQLELPCVQGQ
jgi:hypothetical protein